MRNLNGRRKLYSKVFDQAFSPCGRFLAVSDVYGTISVFDLDVVLSSQQVEKDSESENDDEKDAYFRNPAFQLFHPANKDRESSASNVRMYSLESSQTHLICGDSEGKIFFYRWSDLEEKEQGARPVSVFPGTKGGTPGCPAEINALRVSKEGNFLLSGGAGDNNLNVWNLENGELKTSLGGHTDYIHDLALRSQNEVFTASEDGTVRFWDLRTGSCNHVINPSKSDCARQNQGAWVGCVAADQDWMVCGGGPSLGVWHLGSMSLAKVMNAGDSECHSAIFYDDKIMTGGSRSRVHHWDFRGEQISEIPVSPLSVYKIAANTNNEQYRVLTACGSSSKVDVFINPGYKAFSLETFPL